ncbi:hypothetical protein [Curtobacterium sp. ZW137]|uniref:hypothetical protein n=1 Tax=Curtobacterium sp. ZW137 TaxID=2485104 RepID=UPI000F4C9AC9|nr:hypothetical protein [Curtobacterium sp. ZW137]ROP65646.1 hypothetical protein EDF55_0083 [Curtobacterium sp. ZW137]
MPLTPGYPGPQRTGDPVQIPGPLDPLTAHRTRTNTRISFDPISYDSEVSPLYAWQLDDER